MPIQLSPNELNLLADLNRHGYDLPLPQAIVRYWDQMHLLTNIETNSPDYLIEQSIKNKYKTLVMLLQKAEDGIENYTYFAHYSANLYRDLDKLCMKTKYSSAASKIENHHNGFAFIPNPQSDIGKLRNYFRTNKIRTDLLPLSLLVNPAISPTYYYHYQEE